MVVSGTGAALTEAAVRFKEAGARRFIVLQVAGPFHSPLMQEAADEFQPALNAVAFHDPLIPLYSNVTGKRVVSGEEAKKLALIQITEAVKWTDEEAAINGDSGSGTAGIACLETGPGQVLQGLWRDSQSAIPCYAAGTVKDVEALENTDGVRA
jgi:[acyl-carrier-protein] S-malonyltransferase